MDKLLDSIKNIKFITLNNETILIKTDFEIDETPLPLYIKLEANEIYFSDNGKLAEKYGEFSDAEMEILNKLGIDCINNALFIKVVELNEFLTLQQFIQGELIIILNK